MLMSKRCEELKRKIEEGVANYNAALQKGDFNGMTAAEKAIKDAEGEYAQQAQLDLFSSHKGDENPVLEVLKEGFFGVYRHKPVRDEGTLIGWELAEAERQVDMNSMFTYFQRKDKVWKYRCERMTEVLCEWVCEEIGRNSSDVKDTFKMSEKARAIDVGPKPTSNSSMLRLLQACIDEIVNVPDKDGKNTVRANNRDLKFLQHCFDGEGRGRNVLKTMKASGVIRVIGKNIYRITNGYAYSVDFKTIVEKNDSLEAQRVANANRKAEAAKEAEKSHEGSETTAEVMVVTKAEDAA